MSKGFEQTVSDVMALGMTARLPGRDIMRKLLKAHSHPERGFGIIHIAGTNGKGSTAFYLSKLMEACGHKVGLYTSPHLIRLTERIRVDGRQISEEDFTRLARRFLKDEDATASDVLLLTALYYFKEQSCDLIIIETGLGGRLDSTNALTDEDMGGAPILTVITKIGYDHTLFLGDTLEKIASEKAGIIKPHTKVVISDNQPSVVDVIAKRCRNENVFWTMPADDEGLINEIKEKLPDAALTYQLGNIAAAAAGVRLLGESVALDVLNKSCFPGRFQIVRENPLLIVDGAHNPDGASALCRSVTAAFCGRRFDCIIGIVRDKDAKGIVDAMLPVIKSATVVETGSAKRRTDSAGLITLLNDRNVPCEKRDSVKEALEALAGRDVLVFGSLYLAGEAISLL